MPYVDGFVLPIPKRKLDKYRNIARQAGKIWKKLGALEYRECVGDDMFPKGAYPFPKLARVKPGQTVVFSWIVYKSRAHRDRVNAKVMKDPGMLKLMSKHDLTIFDMKRMAYGGFRVIVDL
jgi:uncharacterized protein YbaA (DUF1428 family)